MALLFDAWRHADGWLGLPGWPRVDPACLPNQQQLQDAGDAVRGQADAVRQLKQGQGLGNKVRLCCLPCAAVFYWHISLLEGDMAAEAGPGP
jgi:hypothetical protein